MDIDVTQQLKKREGIALIVDPSYSTEGRHVKLQIKYTIAISILDSKEITAEYSIWSQQDSSFVVTLSKNHKINSEKRYSKDGSIQNNNLPGWNGCPIIFIPATSFKVKLMLQYPKQKDGDTLNSFGEENYENDDISAKTAYELHGIKIIAFPCSSNKVGVKKLLDNTQKTLTTMSANYTVDAGASALSLASFHGCFDVVAVLISKGANINVRNKSSFYQSALVAAVLGSQKEIIKYLLKNGANQLLRDDQGRNALHHACIIGSMDIIRILLESENSKRALQSTDNYDKKPYDLCSNEFIKVQIENKMKFFKIFVKPRVSLLKRGGGLI